MKVPSFDLWRPSLAIFLALFVLVGVKATAQASEGNFDPSFTPPDLTLNGSVGSVYGVETQSYGRVIAVGSFNDAGGTTVGNIVRLLADGTPDSTFMQGTGANGIIRTVVINRSGYILIGGDFTQYNGMARNQIARLTPNGALDLAFDPGSGFDGPVYSISEYQTGELFVGGAFSNYQGVSRANLAKLEANGDLDMGFSSGTNGPVYVVYSDRRLPASSAVLVGGNFTQASDQPRNNLAGFSRLGSLRNINSSIGDGPNGPVHAITGLDWFTDYIAVGGAFSLYSGVNRGNYAILLNSSSSRNRTDYLDTRALPSANGVVMAASQRSVYQTAVLGGAFTDLGGVSKNRIGGLKLTSSWPSDIWSVDNTYGTSSGANDLILCMTATEDDKILVGGIFTEVDGQIRSGLARLLGTDGTNPPSTPSNFMAQAVSDTKVITTWSSVTNAYGYRIESSPDGVSNWAEILTTEGTRALLDGLTPATTLHLRIVALSSNGTSPQSPLQMITTDSTVWTGPGIPDPAISSVDGVQLETIVEIPDGNLVVAGPYSKSSSSGIPGTFVRRDPQGILDLSWKVERPSPWGSGFSLISDASGAILIEGVFDEIAGVQRQHIARILPDATVDISFVPNEDTPDLTSIGYQKTGKVLVCCWAAPSGFQDLYRLKPSGQPDPTFVSEADRVTGFYVLPDDRILAWGGSMTIGGTNAKEVALLDPEGIPDPGFTPVDVSGGEVYGGLLLGSGKFLIFGNFTSVDGTAMPEIARLHSDGTLDTSFNPMNGHEHFVSSVVEQIDGKLVVAGNFLTVGDQFLPGIYRMNSDGSIDTTFRPREGFYNNEPNISRYPHKIIQLRDYRFCAAGSFESYSNAPHDALAFIIGDTPPTSPPSAPVVSSSPTADSSTLLTWPVAAKAFDYLVQASADGITGWVTQYIEPHSTRTIRLPFPSDALPAHFRVVARNNAGETPGNTILATRSSPYSTWKLQHGIPLGTSAQSDWDHDNRSLLLEYAVDTDPNLKDVSAWPQLEIDSNTASLVVPMNRSDLIYEAEVSYLPNVWTKAGLTESAGINFSASIQHNEYPNALLRCIFTLLEQN